MALRILKTDQSLVQRSPREEEPDYLAWIRELPCVVTLMRPVEAAHIRFNDARYGKITGGQEKPDDMWVLPLTNMEHRIQTHIGESVKYWENLGMDPHAMCLALRHIAYPSIEEGERLVRAWNGWIK